MNLVVPVHTMGNWSERGETIVSVLLLSRIFRTDGFMTGTIDVCVYRLLISIVVCAKKRHKT